MRRFSLVDFLLSLGDELRETEGGDCLALFVQFLGVPDALIQIAKVQIVAD